MPPFAAWPTVPGWSDPGGDGHVAMRSELPDGRCEFCRIMVGPGETARGSLTSWLTRNRYAFIDEDDREGFDILQPAEASTLGAREAATMAMSDGSEMLFLIAMYALECLVAFLQAYVFAILTSVYIGGAISTH